MIFNSWMWVDLGGAMEKKLLEVLKKESYFNPLTDEQIGEKLNVGREQIVLLRQRLSIENSRERLKKIF